MKRIIYLGLVASFGVLTSCGGGENTENTENSDSTKVEEIVEVTVMNYTVDTSISTINWKGYSSPTSEEDFHFGTVGILNGTFEITTTNGENAVTAGSLTVDMNSIQSGETLDKLVGHLNSPDFFDVNQFATSSFAVTGFEEGSIMGTLNVMGTELNITAPASIDVTEGVATVSVSEFRVDLTGVNMPFFVEDAKAPAEEQHDPKIGVSATIVGM